MVDLARNLAYLFINTETSSWITVGLRMVRRWRGVDYVAPRAG